MKVRAQIAHGAEPRQVHRLPHLLCHLQERVDQPRGRRIRLVQQRRDQARRRLSQGLGEPEALEGRLDAQARRHASSRASAPNGACWRRSSPTPTCRRSTTTTSRSPSTTRICRTRRKAKAMPTARPRSLISGERMEKIEWGPNWEEILGGEFAKRSQDSNFEGVQKEIYGAFENTFMMYLPRLCEHCLNPACAAACPSGAIYKREEDGIVLIDQDKCRGWRMCVSGCPYKKIYYNWSSGKVGEMHLLLPAHRGRAADGMLGNLRRPHPLSRRDAVRRRPDRGGGLGARRGRSLRGAAEGVPRSVRSGSAGAGARRRHFRCVAGGREALAGVADGDGLEDRLPAASGIPHAADGLVRAAAVARSSRPRPKAISARSAACRT